LRKNTIEKLKCYVFETNYLFPNTKKDINLNELLREFNGEKKQALIISHSLPDVLGKSDSAKLLSKMTTYFNRQCYEKVSIELHSDTNILLVKKRNEFGYTSIDSLINDALVDFKC